ncbi:hypothetical protein CRV02_08395 [Arcobacter sp. CECT 8989]|uniref:hypothetical protein n=1 Tax=Arcobacter sp. CECT 8989 TaxID=2044509 RepID=UPI00100BD8C0|nr:hypothetical protein [Arcobacter sp. CECT 8989]RXK01519.1 hypothetical protein CRV02_08395 [Arcobacter sp. CECT 8989]
MKKTLLLILAIALFFAYGIYEQVNKKTIKSKRVACQEQTTTFEKISNKDKIKEAINLLKTQNIKMTSDIEYSTIMKSVLINHYTKKNLQTDVDEVLSSYFTSNKDSKKKLEIDYYIYENDKEDKGKKNKKAKLYAGYLVFEFKVDEKQVYKIQTDYMKEDGNDIKQRIECVFKSFISLNHY